MNRTELDRLVAHYELPAESVERVMQLTAARPTQDELRTALQKFMQIGGVLSLFAGVVFFIAANWEAFGALSRFALVEFALVASVCVAWMSAPGSIRYRLSTLSAFLTTGALLALFGQSYQTGADVYELFFLWALLGLPFVIASRWSANWIAWFVVLNVALTLFCGFVPGQGVLWVLFARWHFTTSLLVLLPAFFCLGLWWASEQPIADRIGAASSWLTRLSVISACAYATWAGVIAVFQPGTGFFNIILPWLLLAMLFTTIGIRSLIRRTDVLPLTAAVASVTILGAVMIGKATQRYDSGLFFGVAFWLVTSSTLAGKWLTYVQRDFRLHRRV